MTPNVVELDGTQLSLPRHIDAAARSKLPSLTPRRRSSTPQNPLPVPEAPPLPAPPDLEELHPRTPARRILSQEDHGLFLKSSSYSLVLSFVFSLADACADTKISSVTSAEQPPIIRKLEAVLDSVSSLVDSNPPVDQGSSRFGNPAFRTFVEELTEQLEKLHEPLGLPDARWSEEVATYLKQAFGSRERIDYGSGHELNFIVWLLCLNRLGILPPSTFSSVALLIFPQYLRLLRRIQSTYYLEPAGSHGVWGLDDYQFLPFLFGASQLLHHPYIRPRAIHNDVVLDEEGDEYLYLDMVRYTVSAKTVKGLQWTQPMLDDISSAKNWEKVEQGMRRMFVKEVLGKLPIMQHFLFGTLVPAEPGMSQEHSHEAGGNGESSHDGHDHNQWGDCCGIKVPSTVAASEEARKHSDKETLRRIPFDWAARADLKLRGNPTASRVKVPRNSLAKATLAWTPRGPSTRPNIGGTGPIYHILDKLMGWMTLPDGKIRN